MRSFLATIILAASLLHYIRANAQGGPGTHNADYIISKRFLSIEDGLASHEVFCGVQDNRGFLWFGTRNGLNRYDGKNCLLFTRQRNNLQHNKVVQLARDDNNNLFIEYGSNGFQLTTNGMVDVINTITHKIQSLTAAFPNLPFKEQDIYWIANDGTGEVNFLTAWPFRLWKYSTEKGFTLRYEVKDWVTKDSLSYSAWRSSGPLCLFANGNALLKLNNQLTQYLVSHNTVTPFLQKEVLRSLPIGFNSEGNLLITYNTATDVDHFAVGKLTSEKRLETGEDWAKYSLQSVKGRYWFQAASAVNGNACVFYIPTDALYLWHEEAYLRIVDRSELKAFENLFLYQLLPDNQGNLWLCTSHGVIQLKTEKKRFKQYFTIAQQSKEPNSQARGIYSDTTGTVMANIWQHHFRQQEKSISAIKNDHIMYALAWHNNALYSGGFDLFRYHESNNTLKPLPGGIGTEIWSMYSYNDSLLLLGRSNGFYLYNSRSGQFDSLTHYLAPGQEARFVYRFFKRHADTVWAVAENGVYTLTRNKEQFDIAKYQSDFINGLSLLDAYADNNNQYWLATNGEGLYVSDLTASKVQQFNIASGLPSDVIYRIESDAYGNLWMSSDNGLIRFNKKTFATATYTIADGIAHNEFNRTSSFKASDGRLFFGGIDGINELNPINFIKDSTTFKVPLRVIALHQFIASKNELVNKTTELLTTNRITLEPGDKFFTLEFQLLDFEKNATHRYAYKIEGFDKDWNYISENSIRISGVPYGTFVLQVKAQNNEGAWSQSELHIVLEVKKPFYLQGWFMGLMLVLLIWSIVWVIRWRTKKLALDKRTLELMVSERTDLLKKAITRQETLLLEKDVLMKEIHHRVKNNLQVISGLLELQSRNLDNETAKAALMEGRNRVQSIALIHQNLYQFESLSAIELGRFVNDLYRQVATLYKKQKEIPVHVNVPLLYLDIDSAVPLGLILNELLSNSFKYAFNGLEQGEITITIRIITEGKYQLIYFDNGPGLPVDFDLYKASTLGIQLINDLSRQIGGNVQYDNKMAQFTINFTNRNLRKTAD
ncbi:Two-component sensor histidine kinase, contains HisKA and HATPase domains [Filimonas lacunae]|uniref:histidine kinase n=1 Tax=Filimonas lacunae TaxID=477680 RepID=A0A173MCA4_9BACT|nr:histidine kinase dimerization/phosphoacceptor domain -containing protein [Filimonas lacunae]BAV05091.1 sensor histidine kinase [Filimonas lacunae]SIT34240.1 Two-component sensor histidine kinase, contains HisKA and HATPase domains [Filimonas lacunae]